MESKEHKYLKEEKNNMKQMIKYNLKHLWSDHKCFKLYLKHLWSDHRLFLNIIGVILIIAIVL